MSGRIVRIHKWQQQGKGHKCIVCGSTVGVNPGLDSAAFPCPGPPIVRRGFMSRSAWSRQYARSEKR